MDGAGIAHPMNWMELASHQDLSRNFVLPTADGGAIECRFVRREDRYFIVYLSSHSGCRHACRFCHLTQTGATMMTPADHALYLAQAERVLRHYDESNSLASHVNFNFMARGEALSNSAIRDGWHALSADLGRLAATRSLTHRSNLSTIMPIEAEDLDLARLFDDPNLAFYYSLYSLDPEFRRRWLPRAADPVRTLKRLAAWQDRTKGEVVLHWALIENENESLESADAIAAAVRAAGLIAKFNLVRYNPANDNSREPGLEQIQAYFDRLTVGLGSTCSRIVPRVGFDVKASCGMFVETIRPAEAVSRNHNPSC